MSLATLQVSPVLRRKGKWHRYAVPIVLLPPSSLGLLADEAGGGVGGQAVNTMGRPSSRAMGFGL